jgi:translation initiation factor IF-3
MSTNSNNSNSFRINHQIKAQEVFLLGSDKKPLGKKTLREALSLANQEGMDLVEISLKDNIPVCRIVDFGKFKYEQQQKQKAMRQKAVETKEVKVRPVTDDHDLKVKANQIKGWLEDGHKVQIICKFKGREVEHRSLGRANINQLLKWVGPHKVDQEMKDGERQIFITITREQESKAQ